MGAGRAGILPDEPCLDVNGGTCQWRDGARSLSPRGLEGTRPSSAPPLADRTLGPKRNTQASSSPQGTSSQDGLYSPTAVRRPRSMASPSLDSSAATPGHMVAKGRTVRTQDSGDS